MPFQLHRPFQANLLHIATLACAVLGLTVISAQAASYKRLHAFSGDGDGPLGGVIRDTKGNLYGTTYDGGDGNKGFGTVYKLSPSGKLTVLHVFESSGDGVGPMGTLVRDAQGNLYGTASTGGANLRGAVFKVTPSGKESLVYSFRGGQDGSYPLSNLIQDAAGNFYGTTSAGGSANGGVVFKLTPNGNETVLHAFTGNGDGLLPAAGLVMDSAGNLYGTTRRGGVPQDGGVVFKIDPNGVETVLHVFSSDEGGGWDPVAGLIMDAQGNLYGTTAFGGTSFKGVVFKLDPSGNETVLHSFRGGKDGKAPSAALVFDSSGDLYGTTFYGGRQRHGVIFRIDPSGNETVVYTFNDSDGAHPAATLIMGPQGNLYGTTEEGGLAEHGVVFRFKP